MTISTFFDREMRKTKEAEKEKLKKCNNRLVNYIDKVHDLIEANKALKAENAALRKTEKAPEQDISELYEDELAVSRNYCHRFCERKYRPSARRDYRCQSNIVYIRNSHYGLICRSPIPTSAGSNFNVSYWCMAWLLLPIR